MNLEDINLIEKEIRSQVIKEHMERRGIKRAVCFTCGNSTKYLRKAGVEVLSIGDNEELKPGRWFTQDEIARNFPDHFNATSGDLPMSLMAEIAKRMRAKLGNSFKGGMIKTGSGETIIVLCLAYPELAENIQPYRDDSPACTKEEGATLNPLLNAMFHVEHYRDTLSPTPPKTTPPPRY